MGKLITIWEFIGRHKYWITVLAFGVIIGFLDENSMIRRIGYAREISRLQGEIDKYRADYYKYYTGNAWNDARNYDFCLDTSSMSYEKLVAVVKDIIKIYQE